MKKIASVAVAAFLIAGLSAASAQSGDNPGGRGVTSTGGPAGVTGRNPDGTTAAPAPMIRRGMTTGMGGNNAELRGNNGNSASGDNSLGHVKGGNSGADK